jgi:hypothetical protein
MEMAASLSSRADPREQTGQAFLFSFGSRLIVDCDK